MNLRNLTLALVLGVATLPAEGALRISEVLYNEVGSDGTGEWIEIFNSGSIAIDLSNYKIGDEETSGGTGTGESVHLFPVGATIGPGEAQIISVSAGRFQTVYGFLPTYEVNSTVESVFKMRPYSTWDPDGGAFNMSNSNDQAFIMDGSDVVVDAVNWGNTVFLNPGLAPTVGDGVSYERINVWTDTDTAADWQLGAPSSPFLVPEPASLALIGLGFGAALLYRRRN